jgi:hypothetical protein
MGASFDQALSNAGFFLFVWKVLPLHLIELSISQEQRLLVHIRGLASRPFDASVEQQFSKSTTAFAVSRHLYLAACLDAHLLKWLLSLFLPARWHRDRARRMRIRKRSLLSSLSSSREKRPADRFMKVPLPPRQWPCRA